MGPFEIIMLIMSIASIGASIWSQQQANETNIGFANQNREDQQAFNAEQAELANQRNIDNYLNYQSPAATMRQLKEAGLSPGLFYGGSGSGGSIAASQAASSGIAGAPVIQPLISALMASQLIDTMKSKSEVESTKSVTKRTDQETVNLTATYDNIIANTKNEEEKNKLLQNQTRFQDLTNQIAEIEVKYKDAKELKEWEIMGEQLKKLTEEGNKLVEEVKGLQIENKYKDELTLKQIEELDERIKNLCESTILTHKEALRAELARRLDAKQLEAWDKNIQQLEESINNIKQDTRLKEEQGKHQRLENDWFEANKFLQFVLMALKIMA